MKTLIIIPTFNEELNIENLIKEINLKLNGYDFSILIVDDNSKDSTAQIVKNLQKDYSNLYILERGGKFGLAYVCRRGRDFPYYKW